jgi:feruloyl esterase
MMAAERFPALFDGIAACAPGFNLPKAAVAQAWDSQAFGLAATELDAAGQPYLPTSFSNDDLALVGKAVLAECDLADGLADGIVSDARACRFDPKTLLCRSDAAKACLSSAQVMALERVFAGARDSQGRTLYADWPWDPGIASVGWRIWKLGVPNPARANNGANLTLGASALPYVFMTPPERPAARDLAKYAFAFDFDRDAPRIFSTSGIYRQSSMSFMAAASTDLRRFERRGGRIVLYHGTADPVFSSNDTIEWFEALQRGAPRGDATRVARLFLVPGMNHCGGGPATDSFDQLAPVVRWVEEGVAPDAIVARANAESPWPARTRPLCAYPKQARYAGSGDVDDARNFVCR